MDSVSQALPAAAVDKMLALVGALVAEVRGPRPPHVALDSALERDLGLDSLARVELLARIERAFDVRLPDDALETALTPRDLVAVLQRAGHPGEAPAEAARQAGPELAAGFPEEAADLVAVLDWHAAREPGRRHVTFYRTPEQTESLSYGELAAASTAIAASLAGLGVAPGQRVALMLPSGLDFFRCFFGILRAGAVPVPMYPPARASQIEDHLRRQAGILRNCEASLLIAFEAILPLARMLTGLAPSLGRVVLPRDLGTGGDGAVAPSPAPGELALLQYTSGSTGDPKGVGLSHANLLANIRGFGRALDVASTDVCVSWLPLYHDMGLIGAWMGSLYHACPLVLMSPLDFLARPERWLWAIHRHRGTITAAPNFAFELCRKRRADMALAGLDLSSWRLALNGAEPVSPDTLDAFAAAFSAYGMRRDILAPVYGLAECSLALTVPPPGRAPRIERVAREPFTREARADPEPRPDRPALRFVSCGTPLAGHTLRVVDAGGRPLPERRVGRLEFRGPSVTAGYYRNPAASAALFHDGWADSGDFAYVAEGELYVTGRAKDMIVRGGRNFYPYELEQAVGDLPGVRKGCVAAFGTDEPGAAGEQLVVVAETREGDPDERAALEQRIVALASDVLGLPPDVVVLAPPHAVLKTSSGKIRRSAIRERYRRGTLEAGARAAWLQYARMAVASAGGRLRRDLAAVPHVLYGVWVWAWFVALSSLAALAIVLLPKLEWRWSACRRLARLLGRLSGSRLEVSGCDHLPRGPCVLVANHASYIDGFVLAAALPEPVAFVGKAELARSPVLRVLFERMGAHFVERFEARKSVADARTLAEAASRPPPLLFFAEGTFRREPGLRAFHLGAFQVAAQARVPVVPVALAGTREVLREGTRLPRRGHVSVTVCAPLAPEGEGWHGVLALRDRTRDAILAHCDEPVLEGA